jgi:hypothetical protein
MTSFGPSPIPQTPGALQSSFIARESSGPRARDRAKPPEVDRPQFVIKDEVRITDPIESEAIDPKPDAVEEWKHRRPRSDERRPKVEDDPRADGGDHIHLDIKA